MLRPLLARFQALLTVAGSLCVITSIVLGADAGVLSYGLHASLPVAIGIGTAVGLAFAVIGVRFQAARWHGAEQARLSPISSPARLSTSTVASNPPADSG